VLEVLQFVFSSFWVWLGVLVLMTVPVLGVIAAIGALPGCMASTPRRTARAVQRR
jgi:hypothetical protein